MSEHRNAVHRCTDRIVYLLLRNLRPSIRTAWGIVAARDAVSIKRALRKFSSLLCFDLVGFEHTPAAFICFLSLSRARARRQPSARPLRWTGTMKWKSTLGRGAGRAMGSS